MAGLRAMIVTTTSTPLAATLARAEVLNRARDLSMSTVTLTYHTHPPDGGTDLLLEVSTTVVVALKNIHLAAAAIARQYPRARPERTSDNSWRIIDLATRYVLATLAVSDVASSGGACIVHAEAQAEQPDVVPTRTRRRSTDLLHSKLSEGDPTVRRLTPKEHTIALAIVDGLPDSAIARRLSISQSTVQTYSRRIQGRLGLTSRSQIADWVRARRVHREHPLLQRLDDSRPSREA